MEKGSAEAVDNNGEGNEEIMNMELFIDTYAEQDDTDGSFEDTIIHQQILEAISLKDPAKLYYFYIDYNILTKKAKEFVSNFNDFNIFSKQFGEVIKTRVMKENRIFFDIIKDINIKVRFKNFLYSLEKNEFSNLTSIRSINSQYMDKYLCFRGIIRNIIISDMNLMKLKFKCLNCKKIMNLDFNDIQNDFDGKFCTNPECKSDNLEMQKTIGATTDSQTLVIEEMTTDANESDAASVNVLIDGDLVNRFNLGDTVIVSGNMRFDVYNDIVVNQLKKKTNDMKYYKHLSMYGGSTNGIRVNWFIEANYIQKINETNIMFNVLTKKELKEIERLRTDHHLIDKMVQSFAPDIYGYELEKEVLIYQLVGGNGRSRDPELDKRAEIHVFFIGDSATAKTELMKWSLGIAHKCRKVYAGNMTKTGLSGGAEQSTGGNWVLTAGAAVVADRGLLGIDELAHAPAEAIQPLNEIMEDQFTTITKIKRGSFNTRVAIIACANPPGGNRYDKSKTFMENIGINVSLLTRFDYISLFRDIPEPQKDRKIAEKILKSYKKENIAPYSRELLAKYIHYCKNRPHIPQFSKEAEEEFLNYYEKIRTLDLNENAKHPDEQEHVSITARQLPSLHRFATARAILYWKDEVEKEDVERAEVIMDSMLYKMGVDPDTGKIDSAILMGAKPTSQMTRETIFFNLLERMAHSFYNKVDLDQFKNELRKQPKWGITDIDESKLDRQIKKYEDQQNIIIVDDIISLRNFVPTNTTPKNR